MRVLFFNEGNLGTHVLGQSQLDAALHAGLGETPDVEARFAGLGPLGRWSSAVANRRIPGLSRRGLDLHGLRWYLVQSGRARRAIARELRRRPVDVVHVHTQSIAFLAGPIMRRMPVTLSVDTTGRDWAAMPAWSAPERSLANSPSWMVERRALRGAALVVAWTEWARRGVEREEPRARAIAHHPGIDLERYRPVPRRERARPRVLFVGGRFRAKGGEDLLSALQGSIGSEVELDLVTPAAVEPRDGVRVHRLTSSDPQLLDLFQQADLLCLPTLGDTNPWVLLEAMACETPVIATRVGAIPEMLDDGRAGMLVPYGDPRALREALLTALSDPQRRAELGRSGRVRCEQRYDARRQFPILADQMRGLLDQRRVAGRPPPGGARARD
jgi:glycosyltransferase involved in cell wall biosynthesis